MKVKIFSGHWQPLFQFNTPVCLLSCCCALIVAGCTKKSQPAAPPAAETNQAAAAQAPVSQQPSTAAPAATAIQPAAGPDLRELDRGMIRWIVSNRRRPNNFEDFAATANITIPPPPAGKKYIIDRTMHIQLVDR